jgi:hypothetical protein
LSVIKPDQIPQFTGNLTQLETDYADLKKDAGDVRKTGGDVHSQFQGLSAYYTAPEAEQLFATTKPVKERADDFATDLETVSGALSSYATEVRPLVDKLKQLKADATTFVASVKDDDEWEYDEDKVDEHNQLRDDITATVAAFWAAERTCHNKITALWGGTQMVAGDGSDRKDQYGFNADDLKNAKLPWGDPVEEKHHWYEVGHWVKSFVWDGLIVDGVWGTIKGLGTLVGFGGWDAMGQAWKGLAQLATGLALSSVPGLGALFWTLPDDKLPSWIRDSRTAMKETGKALVAWDEWGKNPGRAAGAVTFNVLTTVFTGGAGGAAAGAGKAGAVAKVLSVAGKAGKVIDPMTYIAKGAGAGLSKIGDIAKGLKGVGAIDIPTLPEGAFTLPEGAVKLPDGTVHLPEGTALPEGATRLPDGNIQLPHDTPVLPPGTTKLPSVEGSPAQYMDGDGNLLDHRGNVIDSVDNAPTDVVDKGTSGNPASGADVPRVDSPVKEPALVGAGTHTADQAAQSVKLGDSLDTDLGDVGRVGDDAPTTPTIHAGSDMPTVHAGGDLPGGTVADHLPSGSAGDHLPSGQAPDMAPTARVGEAAPTGSTSTHVPGSQADGLSTGGTSSSGHDLPGSSTTDALPGHPREVPPGGGTLDELGGTGDDALGDTGGFGDDIGHAGDETPGQHPEQHDSGNGVGQHADEAARQREIMDEQVQRANHEPGYFERYYKSNGNRKSLELFDETGTTPPQLTRESANHPWTAVHDAPPPLKPRYLGDWVKTGPDSASPEAVSKLNDAAETRHLAVHHDTAMDNWKQEARQAHDQHPTWETEAEKLESHSTYKESHVRMRDASEAYGEAVAEHHVIPERYPGATREPLDGPANGNDQFDQVWRREDGGYVVVEAKSSVDTDLGARNLPNGKRVSQGTRDYFLDIIREMDKRGKTNEAEADLAERLSDALDEGKLDYIVVKGERNAGHYAGYRMRQFDISDRSIP